MESSNGAEPSPSGAAQSVLSPHGNCPIRDPDGIIQSELSPHLGIRADRSDSLLSTTAEHETPLPAICLGAPPCLPPAGHCHTGKMLAPWGESLKPQNEGIRITAILLQDMRLPISKLQPSGRHQSIREPLRFPRAEQRRVGRRNLCSGTCLLLRVEHKASASAGRRKQGASEREKGRILPRRCACGYCGARGGSRHSSFTHCPLRMGLAGSEVRESRRGQKTFKRVFLSWRKKRELGTVPKYKASTPRAGTRQSHTHHTLVTYYYTHTYYTHHRPHHTLITHPS